MRGASTWPPQSSSTPSAPPAGKRNGQLSGWHPVDLAAETLKALVERNDLDPALVDDVIMGCVMQVGAQALNIGRNAVLAAGFPESVPSTTIDRQCGSSQQAAHFAAQGVMAGAYDIVIAAGVEVDEPRADGRLGHRSSDVGFPFGDVDRLRYADVGGLVPQGISAEMIADKWDLSRDDLDAFGARASSGPSRPPTRAASTTRSSPSGPSPGTRRPARSSRPTPCARATRASAPAPRSRRLANLKPAFKPDGKVTAGNSSQICDGASALLIMSEEKAKALGLTPGPASTPSPSPASIRSRC